MTETSLNERITRLLAYMLRHQPDDFDVELDRQGFGEIEQVKRALVERTGEDIEVADIEGAISGGDRQRYEIQDGQIRALYGHSIQIDPGESTEPPKALFLGMPAREQERMKRFGLRGGRRRFLHLSLTEEEAKETGARTAVEYVVVQVNATDAWEQGVDFFDRKSIWLAPELPSYSLSVLGTFEDGSDPAERRKAEGRGPRTSGESRGRSRTRGRRERTPREERPAPAPKAAAPKAAPAGGGFGAGVSAEAGPASKSRSKPASKPSPEPPSGGGFGAGI